MYVNRIEINFILSYLIFYATFDQMLHQEIPLENPKWFYVAQWFYVVKWFYVDKWGKVGKWLKVAKSG